MNKLLLLLLIPTFSLQAQQNFNTKSLQVTPGDLEATIYEKDSLANAFYIYENGESEFEDGGKYEIVTKYEAKIKILNQDGYDHSTVKIRLYKSDNSYEKIDAIKATTYWQENGITKSKPLFSDQIYTKKNENYDEVSFTFPAVTPGAVLTYSYEKKSPFRFNFNTWWFQEDIPKIYSRYETKIPGNYRYNIKSIGGLKLKDSTRVQRNCFYAGGTDRPADCVHTVYEMENIPAFIEEDYLSSKYNYIARIEYELMEFTQLDGYVNHYTKDWKDVDKEFRTDKGIGRQLRKGRLVDELLPSAISSMPKNLEKAQAIYNFVKSNYRWNGEYKIHSDEEIKDLIKNGTGNISTINILLHNLLNEEEFNVTTILSSTRSNGVPTKLYPVLSEFNYLTVQLDLEGEKYFLDPSEKYLEFGNLPFRALNSYGRLMDFDNESSWIDLSPRSYSNSAIQDTLKISLDGMANISSQQLYTGYQALKVRNFLDQKSDNLILEQFSNLETGNTINFTEIENKTNLSKPLIINSKLERSIQKVGENYYLNPFSFKFWNKNPFQSSERSYPIDFGYMNTYTYMINISIPETLKLKELPEQKLIKLPENGGIIQFVPRQLNEKEISIIYRITFLKNIYSSAYYPYLKEFFDAILTIQNQSVIVLKENT